MNITTLERTSIPNTPEGQIFGKEYQKRLRDLGVFRSWKEDSVSIIITAEYRYSFDLESEAADDPVDDNSGI